MPTPDPDLRFRQAAELQEAGRLDEAERAYRDLIAVAPRELRAHHNLAGLYRRSARLPQAEAAYRAALAVDPGSQISRYELGLLMLSQGRYGEGLPLYDARHEVPALNAPKPKLPFPEWKGEPVAGRKLLIWPEQGFGDQMMCARFAPVLRSMGADVTVLCAPELARLFSSLGVHVVAASGAVEFPDPDCWVMAGGLARRLGLTPETLPAEPYLSAQQPRASGARIGLVWKGDPRQPNNPNRSFASRPDLPGISLHPEDTGARDFQDTADIIAGLDLVISVCTSVAHLAGAMGKPCWVMIPRLHTHWPWLRDRADSPWYPSVRLFRQQTPGDWSTTVHEVRAALDSRQSE